MSGVDGSTAVNIDLSTIVAVIALGVAAILSIEKLLSAGKSIKKTVVDDPKSKVVNEAKSAASSVKTEIAATVEENKKENEREHEDIRRMLDNDSQSLKSLRRDVEDLLRSVNEQQSSIHDHDERLKAREDGEKVILLSLKALLNERLNVGETHDLIDASTGIDNFLINGRK